MSRGPGRVQRALLARLAEDYDAEFGRPELWLCVSTLDLGLGEHPESRRRAAHGLARAGLIEIRRSPGRVNSPSGRFADRVSRMQLYARLPLAPDQQAHVQRTRLEYEATMAIMLDPNTETRDIVNARAWIDWYQQRERTWSDLDGESSAVQ